MSYSSSPEANYLTRVNIAYPGTSTQATAAAAAGRLDLAARLNVSTVTGGTVTAAT